MQNDAIAAIPLTPGSNVDKTLLRNLLVQRIIYTLADSENPQAFEAVDAGTGALPRALAWHETIFWLDGDDATTAHDGITCLVTGDGYRYKVAGSDFLINSVLSATQTDPPDPNASPSEARAIGDAYLVPAGAGGDWADHEDEIAVYTTRGWMFAAPRIGQIVLAEDTDANWQYRSDGAWHETLVNSDESIRPAAVIAKPFRWIVVNQTTNAPPASPSLGVAYIIGSVPTGVWAGHAGKIAVCIDASPATWEIHTPREGELAYDQALNIDFRFDGSAWVENAGAIIDSDMTALAGTTGVTAGSGTTGYTYSNTVAPTTTARHATDDGAFVNDYAAKKVGARLRFSWRGLVTFSTAAILVSSGSDHIVAALLRDTDATALDWIDLGPGAGWSGLVSRLFQLEFEAVSTDVLPHDYKIAFFASNDSSNDVEATAMQRRRIALDEYA